MILHPGSSGPDVGKLQQTLIEAGYPIDQAEAGASSFGESTQAAVEAFQHAHVGPDHHALGEDGIVGPFTEWALEHPGGSSPGTVPGWRRARVEPASAREVLAAAIAEIGVREEPDGSNRGPRVDVYTAPHLGEPWCADFVSWAWGRYEGGSPFGRIRGVYTLEDWGRSHGRIVDVPRPGDVWLILRPPSHGHTGIVVSVSDDGESISTCEGNAANAVRGLVRPVAAISLFIRPVDP
jgi:hypothetical protein